MDLKNYGYVKSGGRVKRIALVKGFETLLAVVSYIGAYAMIYDDRDFFLYAHIQASDLADWMQRLGWDVDEFEPAMRAAVDETLHSPAPDQPTVGTRPMTLMDAFNISGNGVA